MKGAQHALVKKIMGSRAGDILSIEDDSASIGLTKTGDYVEEGGFSGSIWPNQASN